MQRQGLPDHLVALVGGEEAGDAEHARRFAQPLDLEHAAWRSPLRNLDLNKLTRAVRHELEHVADLEGRLRWHSTAEQRVEETVAEWARSRPAGTVPADSFAESIRLAIARAGSKESSAAQPEPYGCFVSPEVRHG